MVVILFLGPCFQDLAFGRLLAPEFNEFVHILQPGLRVRQQGPQLGFSGLVVSGPLDRGGFVGQKEAHRQGKQIVQRLFPRVVCFGHAISPTRLLRNMNFADISG